MNMHMWIRSDPVVQVPCPRCMELKDRFASYHGLVCFKTVYADDGGDLDVYDEGKCDKCGEVYKLTLDRINKNG